MFHSNAIFVVTETLNHRRSNDFTRKIRTLPCELSENIFTVTTPRLEEPKMINYNCTDLGSSSKMIPRLTHSLSEGQAEMGLRQCVHVTYYHN